MNISNALNALFASVFGEAAEKLIDKIFGDYFLIIIVGFFFVFFFIMTCSKVNEVSMSQEEWNRKHGNDTRESKPTNADVAICIIFMVVSGCFLAYQLSRKSFMTPLIRKEVQQNQAEEFFLGHYDDGKEAYLQTDTVQYIPILYEDGGDGYTCTVKSVEPSSGKVNYAQYKLIWYQSELLSKDDKDYTIKEMQQFYEMPHSVEMQIIYYLRNLHEKENVNSSSENLTSEESPDITPENKQKIARLIMCGHWEGENGADLIISTSEIVEFDSKTHRAGERFSYFINSIEENDNGATIRAEFIQGGTSFYADLIFKDINNMTLKNYATKETLTYRASTKPYPQHLDNSLQYIFIYGHMGSGFYMDLETLQVIDDMNWTFNVVSVNVDNGKRGKVIKMEFSMSDGIPFALNDDGNWSAVNVDDTTGSNMLRRNAFLTSYYYAFGRNFGEDFR